MHNDVESSSDGTPLAPRKMLADNVYDLLLGWLLDGRVPSGSQLSIDGLARQLQVSATPIREALARLESTGLVARTALKGYRVAPVFTGDDIIQLMEARLVLEPVNARLAAGLLTAEVLAELRLIFTTMREAPQGPSFDEFRVYWEADEAFHRLIANGAGNRFLSASYAALGGQVQRVRLFSGASMQDASMSIGEHEQILLALERHDSDGARDAMQLHITGARQRALRQMGRTAT